jgi:hypothetical protein
MPRSRQRNRAGASIVCRRVPKSNGRSARRAPRQSRPPAVFPVVFPYAFPYGNSESPHLLSETSDSRADICTFAPVRNCTPDSVASARPTGSVSKLSSTWPSRACPVDVSGAAPTGDAAEIARVAALDRSKVGTVADCCRGAGRGADLENAGVKHAEVVTVRLVQDECGWLRLAVGMR